MSAMALLEPGDVAAADALTYPGFKLAAEACHLELVSIPAAGRGPDPDVLAQLCKRRKVRAIYAMPTLHNPLGWVMAAQRRRELVAIARKHDLNVIEDGAYAFLEEAPPPPIAALAPERTVYVSGLSKSVATGLRVGMIHGPQQWIEKLERAIRATTWHTPAVMTAIACSWLEDGTVTRLQAQKRIDARQRQDIVTETLRHLKPVRHPTSYFVWLSMPEEVRADAVSKELMRADVLVSPADPYATSKHIPHAIRLELGSGDVHTLRQSLQTVARAVAALAY